MRFGEALAQRLRPGDVLALSGGLGAGKTTLVRSIVRALHGADTATSPTFTFRHRYVAEGRAPIEHLDLYRLDEPHELVELGLEEAFDGDAIVLIEWWERAPALLPKRYYTIAIEGSGTAARTVTLLEPA